MKDCAIVCGYPTLEDGHISPILESRIKKAVELYHEGRVRYLIVSGGSIHNQHNEADAMQNYAVKHDVPQAAILLENKAKSTYHNMLLSSNIMKEKQFKSCYVITNSWHIIKAKYYAQQFLDDFEMKACDKPKNMLWIQVLCLHIYMPINMLINRLKGYK